VNFRYPLSDEPNRRERAMNKPTPPYYFHVTLPSQPSCNRPADSFRFQSRRTPSQPFGYSSNTVPAMPCRPNTPKRTPQAATAPLRFAPSELVAHRWRRPTAQHSLYGSTASMDVGAGCRPDRKPGYRSAGGPLIARKSTGPPGLSSSNTPITRRPVRQASVSRLVRPSYNKGPSGELS
jgi:hypothetical protein